MRRAKSWFVLALFAGVFGLVAEPSEAATACFDWECADLICDFDASCSTGEPYIWKYSFDFGDGTGTGLTGNPVQQHTYSLEYPYPVIKLTIIPMGEDMTTLECQIVVRNVVGPQQDQFGRCTQ